MPQPDPKPVSIGEYISTQQVHSAGTRATKTWRITNTKRGDLLGTIEWESGWRQYVFSPEAGCIFSSGCLTDITKFLDHVNAAHKAERQQRGIQ